MKKFVIVVGKYDTPEDLENGIHHYSHIEIVKGENKESVADSWFDGQSLSGLFVYDCIELESTPVFRALMPEAFGYGLESIANTREEALKLLKKEYFRWRKNAPWFAKTFDEAMEYFGGNVYQINLPFVGAEGDYPL